MNDKVIKQDYKVIPININIEGRELYICMKNDDTIEYFNFIKERISQIINNGVNIKVTEEKKDV